MLTSYLFRASPLWDYALINVTYKHQKRANDLTFYRDKSISERCRVRSIHLPVITERNQNKWRKEAGSFHLALRKRFPLGG